MPPKNCNNVITIKQFTGTCWFNALLMTILYSDRMRQLLIERSKLWKSSDSRVQELYRIFKQILKNYSFTAKTKNKKFDLFDTIKPEHILEALYSVDTKFDFNPKQESGHYAKSYIRQILALLWVDPDTDVTILSDYELIDHESSNAGIQEELNGHILDSVILANFNIDVCTRGHEICGITCRGKRYVYNGWLRYTDENNNKITSNPIPCELMEYDWLNNKDDFCINKTLCKLDQIQVDKTILKKELCFNMHKGDRTYIYIAPKSEVKNIEHFRNQRGIGNKHAIYDSKCIRENSTSDNKIATIMKNIKMLDRNDFDKTGKHFKHVIYTDFKKVAVRIKKALLENDMLCAYTDSQRMLDKTSTKEKFGYLVSGTVAKSQPLRVSTKKRLLEAFNDRPYNTNGKHIRFMILDGSYKEGIDLFDVKYVHVVEPPLSKSDLKQVIGRSTRFCGQRGLDFEVNKGWALNVFIYDTSIPNIVKQRKGIDQKIKTLSEFAASFSDDTAEEKLIVTLQDMIRKNSMDYKYNVPLNNPKNKLSKSVLNSKYTWGVLNPPVNMCNTTPSLLQLSPTQQFITDHLTSSSKLKGILAVHSVGTGKTITAINTALQSFSDYTVLWVTRSSLKTDMAKDLVKFNIENGRIGQIPPLSYKQFANTLERKNIYYNKLVSLNGKVDPLRKVFIIIDEAHKLVDNDDLRGQEKVDVKSLNNMIQNSYTVSGKDSCKVLLMTATPIVKHVGNFFDLVNLIKENQISEDEGRAMIASKSKVLKDWIKQNVSFLDRSADASTFAQYNIKHNDIPMTTRLTNIETKEDLKQQRKFQYDKETLKERYALYKVDKTQEKVIEEKCRSDDM
jgi:superfamily II DNA or RNA helicase